MGFKRVLGSGILGMFILIPCAWLSYTLFDLVSLISGGLLKNVSSLFDGFGLIGALIGAFIGLGIILLFPMHWILVYRPDDPILMIAVMLPWILTCIITSALTAHSPRGGLNTSIAIGLGWMILGLLGSFLLNAIGISALVDMITSALTDLPLSMAIITATMEGALIGGVFGAFIGSLKYEPGAIKGSKKKDKAKSKKVKPSKTAGPEPGFQTVSTVSSGGKGSAEDFCTNCGMKFVGSDEFCTNCGTRKK